MIPYGRQDISEQDIQAVVATLRSDWLTQGPAIAEFEQAMATRCNAAHAVAVCNATAALHLACMTLDLGPDDWLWTTPNTFLASANCARYCGAKVDLVDIDRHSWNMCAERLQAKLERAATAGCLPKIVVPVAFSGQSCDMARIRQLADQYGFYILEDASHAVGASYHGKPVGCGDYADMTVFSFHPVKIITTGEGGLVLTNRAEWAERLRRLRSHGMVREPEQMQGESHGAWYYQQQELGYNYRITDLQAVLGLSQLQRLDEFVARRRTLAERYDRLLVDMPLQLPSRQSDAESAWHLYAVRLQLERLQQSRREIFDELRARGIGVNVHYIPLHLQPYYQAQGLRVGDFPQAEWYYQGALSLPMYAALSDAQQDEVVSVLRDVLIKAMQ